MDIIKDHYEKIIFGSVLALLAWVLLGLKGDLIENAEMAADYTVEDNFDSADKQVLKAVNGTTFMNVDSVKAPSDIKIEIPSHKVMEVPRYLVCSNPACRHVIPFGLKDCPYCNENQGLSKSDEVKQKYFLADDDKDGIINGVEDALDFLDKDVAYDALLDQDQNGFCNLQEIKGDLTDEEAKLNYLSGKFFVHDPANPSDHPELASILKIEASNQAKSMGITLKSVSEEADENTGWLIAINSTLTGRPKTLWKRIGEVVKTNTGLSLTITDIIRNERKQLMKSSGEFITIVDYTVVLKSIAGEIYQVKKDEFVIQGSKTVQFIYLNHHSSKRLTRFEVEEGGKFDLALIVAGKVSSTETFTLGKIGRSIVKIKRQKDGKIFDIETLSSQDKKLISKRSSAVRKAAAATN